MSDLMREEYFEWFSLNSPKLDAQANQHDGRAIAIRDMGFCIWKASRECLEIKLPEAKITGTWHFFGFVRGFRTAQKLIRTLYEIEINKVGVKTK